MIKNRYYNNFNSINIVPDFRFKNSYLFWKLSLFLRSLVVNDVFIFVWNESFLPFNLDFFLLKLSKKKLIIVHCGDEVRYRVLQNSINDVLGAKRLPISQRSFSDFLYKFYYQKISEILGLVISFRDQATFQTDGLFFYKFPQEKLSNFPTCINDKIKIVHAPTDRKVKGTKFVVQAISEIERLGFGVDFCLLENISNDDVINHLVSADILIDQPNPGLGRLGVEGCASGCFVIGGSMPQFINNDSPVLQFPPSSDELVEILKFYINNRELLLLKKQACYQYWLDYYSPESFNLFIEDVLNNKAPKFYPLCNQKQIIIEKANNLERFILKYFYHPKRKKCAE